MKVLTYKEIEILEKLEEVQEDFSTLPYHIALEQEEFKQRIDGLKNIVAIRAMLRDVDGLEAPKENKELSA